MVTLDLQNNPEKDMPTICNRISAATGIPEGNIYLSSTHTHNTPDMSSTTAGNYRYRYFVYDLLVQSAAAAMADRAPATMQLGSFDTDGLNYSRHYYYPDPEGDYTDADGNPISYFGDQFGIQPSNNSIIKRVHEGDETMHLVAFDRQSKQSVLLSNWRIHPHRSGGKNNCWVDADVIGAAREYIHNNTDYLYAYFNGAAGNMNTSSRIYGETFATSSQYKDIHARITAYGNELGRQIIEMGLPTLKSASTGVVQTSKYIYPAKVDHSEDYKYDDAKALQKIYNTEPERMDTLEEQLAVAAEYGFSSYFHASRMLTKYNQGETKDLELNVVSIGEHLAFYTAPGELWDTISVEMEERSPFDTTLVLGYSNGNVAYIPYKVTYSSYEYHYCLFTKDDTINYMMDHWEDTLNQFYENLQ